MKNTHLYAIWAVLFIICAGLGFIPEAAGFGRFVLTLLSLLFFVPPAVLLYQGDRDTVKLIRNLSALSLLVTAVTLICNFLSALGSQLLGNILHGVLVIVSVPMVCSGYWALSLFLWACLLMVSLQKLKN